MLSPRASGVYGLLIEVLIHRQTYWPHRISGASGRLELKTRNMILIKCLLNFYNPIP
jgi:hypothetical protein